MQIDRLPSRYRNRELGERQAVGRYEVKWAREAALNLVAVSTTIPFLSTRPCLIRQKKKEGKSEETFDPSTCIRPLPLLDVP